MTTARASSALPSAAAHTPAACHAVPSRPSSPTSSRRSVIAGERLGDTGLLAKLGGGGGRQGRDGGAATASRMSASSSVATLGKRRRAACLTPEACFVDAGRGAGGVVAAGGSTAGGAGHAAIVP